MSYKITDTITNDAITVSDPIEAAFAIRSLFITDNATIGDAISALVDKLYDGDDTSNEEAFLGIEITCC